MFDSSVENAQTITNSLENILKSSRRKRNLIETDHGKKFWTICLLIFQKTITLKETLETRLQELFLQNRLIKAKEIFLKKLFFYEDDGNRFNVLPPITKQYNNRIHFYTNVTPNQASSEKICRTEEKNKWPNYKIDDLFSSADFNATFCNIFERGYNQLELQIAQIYRNYY